MHAVTEMNPTLRSATTKAVGATMRAVVHPRYGTPDVADALRHVGERHARGQTVITIAAR